MTSNRMFYIGIGCLISTLCWTAVIIAKDEQNLSNLEINRLVCSDIRVLDENGEESIIINDPDNDPKGSAVGYIRIKDNSIRSDGQVSEGYTRLSPSGLVIVNKNQKSVVSIYANGGYHGLLTASNNEGDNTWNIDTLIPINSRTHCPCNDAFDRSAGLGGPVKSSLEK